MIRILFAIIIATASCFAQVNQAHLKGTTANVQTQINNRLRIDLSTNTLSGDVVIDGSLTNDFDFDYIARLTLDATDASITGVSTAYLDGGITTIRGVTNLQVITPAVFSGTATNGQILRLTDAIEGTVEFATDHGLGTGPLLPLRSAASNYWALGDSQTYGQFALVFSFTDGSKRLFEHLRYPNLIATAFGLNLTNRGVSGSRIAYTASSPASTLAQANVIPADWSGLVTIMAGYNDSASDNYGDSMRTATLFRSAGNAAIARLLASDWINPQGKNSAGTTVGTFSTSGGTVSDGGDAGYSPFPIGAPSTDTRKLLTMSAGNTVTFSATNPVVWMQTSPVGGTAQLWQGTNLIAAVNTDTHDSSTYYLPQAMIGLGLSGTFTVTNSTGTNVLLAVGSLLHPGDATGRTIILAPPVRLKSSIRVDSVGLAIGDALRSAAQDWGGYQVGFADTTKVDLSTMIESGDADHPNPTGHRMFAAAFGAATRPDASPIAGAPASRYTDQGFQVKGSPFSTSQYESGHIIALVTASGVAYMDSYESPSGPYRPLLFRAKRTQVDTGGLSVSGSFSGISDLYTGNQFAAVMSSGTTFLDSVNYNGTSTTYLPMSFRASRAQFSAGGLVVSSTLASVSDYYVGNQLALQHGAGISYVDSAAYNGSSLTYLPLYLRGTRTQVANGGFSVSGSFNATSDLYTGNQVAIAMTGGTGYIDSIAYSGSTSFLPMQLRGTSVTVSQGILRVGASSGSPGMSVDSAQNGLSYIDFNTGTTNRWRISKSNATETGSDVGADFEIARYSDAGSLLGTPLSIARSSGKITFGPLGSQITRIRAGTATLVGGAAVVIDGTVSASSIIQLTSQADGGTPGWLRVSTRSAGASFTITSSSGTDTSTVGWVMIEP